ncbi:MAG: hypothetical protein JSV85_07900 [Candidatus Bathyarchaeota archaeon]|nr:MAG: hypothetical protein JSV85_07900 [Candidatus Bathyarchaeota archaeon]
MRFIAVFSIIFIVGGAFFVSGSLFMVPYNVLELARVDSSKTWGYMPRMTISPFDNVTYYIIPVATNASILQIDVESSDFVVLKIIRDVTGDLFFEARRSGTWTYFWTSPHFYFGHWRFVFHNPSSYSVNVTATLTEFYPKATKYIEVEYYRSLFEPLDGYIGLISILTGTAIYVIHQSREAKR